MDLNKREQLIDELSRQPEPQLVLIERFFDGNDDEGSIGCNLLEHPGMDVFRDVLTGLLKRPDVKAAYAQISELDPGDGCWPFADVVLVVGSIPLGELRAISEVLQPSEVGIKQPPSPELRSMWQEFDRLAPIVGSAPETHDVLAVLQEKYPASSVCSLWWD